MNDGILLSNICDSVLCLQLNVPERRNALSRALLRELTDHITGADQSVRGIVITGGEEAFSAGADFRELTGTDEDIGYDDAVSEVTAAIVQSSRIVIAAIEGPCLGAAADIALTCDLRIAGESSYIQVPAIRLGLLYNPTAIDRLRRSYPLDSVRRLLLLGERFDAAAALDAGFLSKIAPTGGAASLAIEWLRHAPGLTIPAVAATKQLLGDPDPEAGKKECWQERRRALLVSEERVTAVKRARSKHA